jgi:hypothetical protein
VTESEWLTGDDHRMMMYFLSGKASVRKLRFFACACCRRVRWYHKHVIELIEKYADGKVKRKDAMAAVKKAIPEGGINPYCSWLFWSDKCHQGADIASAFCVECAVVQNPNPSWDQTDPSWVAERKAHADLLRCIFNNPFRRITFDSLWLTRKVIRLAQKIYDARDFKRLPSLADVLEEAGCDNPEILNHCRAPGPHVRGCWAVDLILGKE